MTGRRHSRRRDRRCAGRPFHETVAASVLLSLSFAAWVFPVVASPVWSWSGEGKIRRGGGPPPLNFFQVRTAALWGGGPDLESCRPIWPVCPTGLPTRTFGL